MYSLFLEHFLKVFGFVKQGIVSVSQVQLKILGLPHELQALIYEQIVYDMVHIFGSLHFSGTLD